MNEKTKIPAPFIAIIPLIVLVALLALVIPTFGSDALLGGSQVSLLVATAVCVAIAMGRYNYKWSVLEEGMAKNIKKVTPAIIILLLIGAISGTWMLSGVVPTLISYGLQILTPRFFLASCCIICAIVSVITGSSWTTIATIGVALLGIGKALGFAEGWIAGAIISGAYFGDKISPLSDTTVLASSTTGTKLFTHIRYMLITTVPSMVITLIIFTVAGFSMSHTDTAQSALFAETLAQKFNLSPWLLVVPFITGVLALAVGGTLHHRGTHTGQAPHDYHALHLDGHRRHLHLDFSASHSAANRPERYTRLYHRLQGPDDLGIREHHAIDGTTRNRCAGGHAGYAGHDGYHLAHHLRHVFRRSDVGQPNDSQHYRPLRAVCTQTQECRLFDCRIGSLLQRLYRRPVPVDYSHRQPV